MSTTPETSSNEQPSRRKWWIVMLVVGVLLIVCLICACVIGGIGGLGSLGDLVASLPGIGSQPTGSPAVGSTAPDFTLQNLEGKSVTLSGLRGNVVLVDFFATWCGPCKQELPHIQGMYTQYKDRGFVVLVLDVGETATQVKPFASNAGYTFPILLDSKSEVTQRYGVRGIPAVFIVDAQGVIRLSKVGYGPGSEKELAQAVEPLLPR